MKILALGDSFTWGEELEDRLDAWPFLIAKQLGCDINNKSMFGTGNYRLMRKLLEEDINQYDIVLIGWSHFDRLEVADEDGVWDLWPGGCRTKFKEQAPYRTTLINYTARHHNDDYLYTQYMMQVVLVQSYLKQHDKKFVMMDAFGNPTYPMRFLEKNKHLLNEVDTRHFLGWPNSTMMDWAKDTPHGPNNHFLKEGHAIIAERVYKCLQEQL